MKVKIRVEWDNGNDDYFEDLEDGGPTMEWIKDGSIFQKIIKLNNYGREIIINFSKARMISVIKKYTDSSDKGCL